VAAVIIDIVLSEPTTEADDLALERAIGAGPTVLAAALRPGGGWLLPLDRFGGARIAAHVHAEVAGDGVVRKVSSTKQASGVALEALSMAAARHAGWRSAVTPGTSLRPDFRHPPDDILTVSAGVLLDGDVAREKLSGRVVFLGLSASGAGDQFIPPVGSRGRPAAGVLLHAAVASSVLAGGLLETPAPWITLLIALSIALMVQLLRTHIGRLPGAFLILLTVLIVTASLVALRGGRLLVPVATFVTAVVLSAILREVVESREAQRETDAILRSLIRKQGAAAMPPMPTGVGGRLQLARILEDKLEHRRREMQRLVSHEIKTPLASISGFGSMLETYSLSAQELQRVAGLIRGEADRLGEMVRTFLDLERLGSEMDDVEPEEVELGELVKGRCDLLAQVAGGRNQNLDLTITEPLFIHGAPQLLERLVDNLVGNALKYSPEGETVEIRLKRCGDTVEIEVTDHGPGIPVDARAHLFERFYRIPGETASGSGLGLAVVKEVADWHGASVEVASSVGDGSSFSVRIPAARRRGEDDAGENPGR
jgi:signal transduction histidine kinase